MRACLSTTRPSVNTASPCTGIPRVGIPHTATVRTVFRLAWLIVGVAMVTGSFAIAGPPAPAAKENQRHREGHALHEALGTFDASGNRVYFRPADGASPVRVLENLALERVTRVLEESRSDRLWTVHGTITEFRGENYLLLTRAVLSSRTVPNSKTSATRDDQPPKPRLVPRSNEPTR